jgi:circadian clock protein KaiC
VTAIIAGERGEGQMTRHGLEEYVSDCVILLDHRVIDQISTRRLRIVKYRGSAHGTNEYPFLIDEEGMSVLPITSLGLEHTVSDERIATGVPRLDSMLGGKGYFRGSTILVSGTAGSGKSSLAAHFAHATCQRGERCLYFAFEESPAQIVRNMRSIGLVLEPWIKKDLLRFHATRASFHGLEGHLVTFHKQIEELQPRVVILDPIGDLIQAGNRRETSTLLTRLIDFLKLRGITTLFTDLTHLNDTEKTNVDISSLVDTWLFLRDIELGGERNRAMYILKSRGMAHSNQIREFLLTGQGIELTDVYVGPESVLTGSSRLAQERREKATAILRKQEIEFRERERERKREALEARITAMRKEFEAEEVEAIRVIGDAQARQKTNHQDQERMAISRRADDGLNGPRPSGRSRKMPGAHK